MNRQVDRRRTFRSQVLCLGGKRGKEKERKRGNGKQGKGKREQKTKSYCGKWQRELKGNAERETVS